MVALPVLQLDRHRQDLQMVIEGVLRQQGRVPDLIKTNRTVKRITTTLSKHIIHDFPIDDLLLDE